MKVNLVNYEMTFASNILSKFAWKMSEELNTLGIMHTITDAPDAAYDINHHIIYSKYRHVTSVNTMMVTHIDSEQKFALLRDALRSADMAVCMSSHMVEQLAEKGLSRDKLTFVLPAHDNKTVPIPVAILTNVYSDGRKREGMLNALANVIDPERFLFRIMGKDWDIPTLKRLGLRVEYYPEFDHKQHDLILQNSKYYLYLGLDEGSMGAIDAKRAGLRIVVTPQGFHRELGIDHSFQTQDELNAIFLELQKPKLPEWTWKNYTAHHVRLWKELQSKR